MKGKLYSLPFNNDRCQGIPVGGYTALFEKLLAGTEVRLNTPFVKGEFDAKSTIYTGAIDEYFNYRFGGLECRSLKFESEILESDNCRGSAVVNYTDAQTPFTRIIEHKHFEYGQQPNTVITKKYPQRWQKGDEPYYPVNDEKNSVLYSLYKELIGGEKNVIFGGRLGTYRYLDMDMVIEEALNLAEKLVRTG